MQNKCNGHQFVRVGGGRGAAQAKSEKDIIKQKNNNACFKNPEPEGGETTDISTQETPLSKIENREKMETGLLGRASSSSSFFFCLCAGVFCGIFVKRF